MAKMTPEQEAAYALDFGVAKSDLHKDAQLAYERLVEQRARARASAPASQPGAEAARASRGLGSLLLVPADLLRDDRHLL